MVGEMMMVTVGLNNQVRQLYTNYEDIYVPFVQAVFTHGEDCQQHQYGQLNKRSMCLNC